MVVEDTAPGATFISKNMQTFMGAAVGAAAGAIAGALVKEGLKKAGIGG